MSRTLSGATKFDFRHIAKSAHLHYVLVSWLLLASGIALTRLISIYIEPRVFSLVLFCALQLVAVIIALKLPNKLFAALHWFGVVIYYVLGLLANTMLPELRAYLAMLFYGYCLAVISLGIAALFHLSRNFRADYVSVSA